MHLTPNKLELARAAAYEILHRGTPGDAAFYARSLVGAHSILELGCGYGRILEALTLALPRARLMGLDRNPSLLLRAQKRLPRRVHVWEADMAAFSAPARFDAIVIPYNGLWCLTSKAEVVSCFRRVREHLRPDGRLLFDVYAAEAFHDHDAEDTFDEEPEFLVEVSDRGRRFRILESTAWKPPKQAFIVRYVIEPIDDGAAALELVLHHHYLLRNELESLLQAAGFASVRMAGGFRQEPVSDAAPHRWSR